MECNQENNKKVCNCSYPCEKKGLCCRCVAYHRSRGELPACYFSAAAEKEYDRSVEHYLRQR